MKKETIFYEEAWYKVNYEIHENHIDFDAWKIEALDEDNIERSDLDSDASLKGNIKWDGCCDFEYKEHYCGLYHAKQFLILMREIYKFKDKIFGNDL